MYNLINKRAVTIERGLYLSVLNALSPSLLSIKE